MVQDLNEIEKRGLKNWNENWWEELTIGVFPFSQEPNINKNMLKFQWWFPLWIGFNQHTSIGKLFPSYRKIIYCNFDVFKYTCIFLISKKPVGVPIS